MRKLFLILLIFPFALACSDKSEVPKGILPRQKMQEVMWDIIRAEEFLNGFIVYKDTGIDKIAESQKWYAKIYQLHKITKKDFDKSYSYYQDHPVLMKQILDSLSKKQGQPNYHGQGTPVLKDTLVKKDSLRKIDTFSINNKKKRIFDSLSRKRILKKISAPQ